MHDDDRVGSACNRDGDRAASLAGCVGVMLDGDGGLIDPRQAWREERLAPSSPLVGTRGAA